MFQCLSKVSITRLGLCISLLFALMPWVGKKRKWRRDDSEPEADAEPSKRQASEKGLVQQPVLSEGASTSSSSSKPAAISASSLGAVGDEGKDYRNVLQTLFMDNTLSAKQINMIARTSTRAGADGVQDLARAGAGGKHLKNLARDTMRVLLKDSKDMPAEYTVKVPLVNLKTKQIEQSDVSFLLPHEMMHWLIEQRHGSTEGLLADSKNPHLLEPLREWCQKVGCEPTNCIPLGLHGDGVPFAAKLSDSLEQLTFNCLADYHLRMLICAVPKKFMAKGSLSWDAIMAVLEWSFRHLALGRFPAQDHLGGDFQDKCRREAAGKPLGCRGSLLQIRADWAFLKQTFNFPSWSSAEICFKCRAARKGPMAFTCTGPSAPWRSARLSEMEFWGLLHDQGIQPSPLFRIPGVTLASIKLDWLHCVDLGITADCLGNLMHEAIEGFAEGSKEKNLRKLWAYILEFYKKENPASKLHSLTLDMIRAKGNTQAPKLRAKGAQARYLVPFGLQLAKLMEDSDPTTHRKTVTALFQQLAFLTRMVSSDSWDASAASASCQKFCLLFEALSKEATAQGAPYLWRTKPKLHFMQELLEFPSSGDGGPSKTWTYADESWGGDVASFTARRGGASSAGNTSLSSIKRFKALFHSWVTDTPTPV
jgi:hypothetical protein